MHILPNTPTLDNSFSQCNCCKLQYNFSPKRVNYAQYKRGLIMRSIHYPHPAQKLTLKLFRPLQFNFMFLTQLSFVRKTGWQARKKKEKNQEYMYFIINVIISAFCQLFAFDQAQSPAPVMFRTKYSNFALVFGAPEKIDPPDPRNNKIKLK